MYKYIHIEHIVVVFKIVTDDFSGISCCLFDITKVGSTVLNTSSYTFCISIFSFICLLDIKFNN